MQPQPTTSGKLRYQAAYDTIVEVAEKGEIVKARTFVEGLLRHMKTCGEEPHQKIFVILAALAKTHVHIFDQQDLIGHLISMLSDTRHPEGYTQKLAAAILMETLRSKPVWPVELVVELMNDWTKTQAWVGSQYCEEFVTNVRTAFNPFSPDTRFGHPDTVVAVRRAVTQFLTAKLAPPTPTSGVSKSLLSLTKEVLRFPEVQRLVSAHLESWLARHTLIGAADVLTTLCDMIRGTDADSVAAVDNLVRIRVPKSATATEVRFAEAMARLVQANPVYWDRCFDYYLQQEAHPHQLSSKTPANTKLLGPLWKALGHGAEARLASLLQARVVSWVSNAGTITHVVRRVIRLCYPNFDFHAFGKAMLHALQRRLVAACGGERFSVEGKMKWTERLQFKPFQIPAEQLSDLQLRVMLCLDVINVAMVQLQRLHTEDEKSGRTVAHVTRIAEFHREALQWISKCADALTMHLQFSPKVVTNIVRSALALEFDLFLCGHSFIADRAQANRDFGAIPLCPGTVEQLLTLTLENRLLLYAEGLMLLDVLTQRSLFFAKKHGFGSFGTAMSASVCPSVLNLAKFDDRELLLREASMDSITSPNYIPEETFRAFAPLDRASPAPEPVERESVFVRLPLWSACMILVTLSCLWPETLGEECFRVPILHYLIGQLVAALQLAPPEVTIRPQESLLDFGNAMVRRYQAQRLSHDLFSTKNSTERWGECLILFDPRADMPAIPEQLVLGLQASDEKWHLGARLRRCRNPDFLLDLILQHSIDWLGLLAKYDENLLQELPPAALFPILTRSATEVDTCRADGLLQPIATKLYRASASQAIESFSLLVETITQVTNKTGMEILCRVFLLAPSCPPELPRDACWVDAIRDFTCFDTAEFQQALWDFVSYCLRNLSYPPFLLGVLLFLHQQAKQASPPWQDSVKLCELLCSSLVSRRFYFQALCRNLEAHKVVQRLFSSGFASLWSAPASPSQVLWDGLKAFVANPDFHGTFLPEFEEVVNRLFTPTCALKGIPHAEALDLACCNHRALASCGMRLVSAHDALRLLPRFGLPKVAVQLALERLAPEVAHALDSLQNWPAHLVRQLAVNLPILQPCVQSPDAQKAYSVIIAHFEHLAPVLSPNASPTRTEMDYDGEQPEPIVSERSSEDAADPKVALLGIVRKLQYDEPNPVAILSTLTTLFRLSDAQLAGTAGVGAWYIAALAGVVRQLNRVEYTQSAERGLFHLISSLLDRARGITGRAKPLTGPVVPSEKLNWWRLVGTFCYSILPASTTEISPLCNLNSGACIACFGGEEFPSVGDTLSSGLSCVGTHLHADLRVSSLEGFLQRWESTDIGSHARLRRISSGGILHDLLLEWLQETTEDQGIETAQLLLFSDRDAEIAPKWAHALFHRALRYVSTPQLCYLVQTYLRIIQDSLAHTRPSLASILLRTLTSRGSVTCTSRGRLVLHLAYPPPVDHGFGVPDERPETSFYTVIQPFDPVAAVAATQLVIAEASQNDALSFSPPNLSLLLLIARGATANLLAVVGFLETLLQLPQRRALALQLLTHLYIHLPTEFLEHAPSAATVLVQTIETAPLRELNAIRQCLSLPSVLDDDILKCIGQAAAFCTDDATSAAAQSELSTFALRHPLLLARNVAMLAVLLQQDLSGFRKKVANARCLLHVLRLLGPPLLEAVSVLFPFVERTVIPFLMRRDAAPRINVARKETWFVPDEPPEVQAQNAQLDKEAFGSVYDELLQWLCVCTNSLPADSAASLRQLVRTIDGVEASPNRVEDPSVMVLEAVLRKAAPPDSYAYVSAQPFSQQPMPISQLLDQLNALMNSTIGPPATDLAFLATPHGNSNVRPLSECIDAILEILRINSGLLSQCHCQLESISQTVLSILKLEPLASENYAPLWEQCVVCILQMLVLKSEWHENLIQQVIHLLESGSSCSTLICNAATLFSRAGRKQADFLRCLWANYASHNAEAQRQLREIFSQKLRTSADGQ